MRILRFALIFIFLSLSYLSSYAYTLSGKFTDEQDKPLPGVSLVVLRDSISPFAGNITGNDGYFTISGIKESNIIVEAFMTGFEAKKFILNGVTDDISLGTVKMYPSANELKELTVYGTPVIEKADRIIIIPSQKEIEGSSQSLGLLNNMAWKMPGLSVNPILQSVTIEGRRPIFMIDGKEEPITKILSLNQNNVLRVEYRNTPDIRYADRGASGIINFIMKPKQEGGSFFIDIDGAVTTGFINSVVSLSYMHGKSEWTVNYNNNWRDYNKQYISGEQDFIAPDFKIERHSLALPSKMKYFNNDISVDYTFKADEYSLFSVTAGVTLLNATNLARQNVVQQSGSETSFLRQNKNNSNYHAPSLNLYYRRQTKKNQTFEVLASGKFSNGDYYRSLGYEYSLEPPYFQQNNTDNNSWNVYLDAFYKIEFENAVIKFGANYSHDFSKSKYWENNGIPSTEKLKKDNTYLYGDVTGRISRLSYSAGVGMKIFSASDYRISKTYVSPKATVVLNLPVFKGVSVNYLFMLDPSLPSLASLSEQIRTIDNILIRQGNMDLKPSLWHRNRIYVRYSKSKFNATLWASYSRTEKPTISQTKYMPESGQFLLKPENGSYDDRVNLQFDLSAAEIFNHLTLSGTIGWDRYRMSGKDYSYSFDNIYSTISAQFYWGKFAAYANFEVSPQYSLSGLVKTRSARFNQFGVQYKTNHFTFNASIVNPFTKKGWITSTRTYSEVNPESTLNYIKNNANMVMIGFIYRVNWGQTIKKPSRTLKPSGVDTGVDVNY